MKGRPPDACETMSELRREIDAIDAELVELLAARAGYIDRAVTLKRRDGLPANVPDRVEEVVANVRAAAGEQGLDEALAERLWRELITWSIERERKHLPD